jgi:hypothetical protein
MKYRRAPKLIFRKGQRFGHWTVIQPRRIWKNGHPIIFVRVECDCGSRRLVHSFTLHHGLSRSCGCSGRRRQFKHGMSRTPEYKAYIDAKTRCVNPNNARYAGYGGRGIKFCFDDFLDFLREVGPRPSKRYSIHRIDNDGDYVAGNVIWTLRRVQYGNRRVAKERHEA